jgi:hypothetical protein
MCFSPEASFAGGVIISSVGIATIRKIHKPAQLVFACIPLFFGIQQIAEGFLWLTIPYPQYLAIQKFSTYTFLVMAEVLWPVMIPLSVLYLEENIKIKRVLWIFLALGFTLSLYYAYCLIFFNVSPQIISYHIHYNSTFPEYLSMPAFIVYLLATITPLFISSIKRTRLLGILMFLSCAVTALFFTQYLTSVWCFFAALISGVIYWILTDSRRLFRLDQLNLLKIKV